MTLFGIPWINDGWVGKDKFYHWLLHFVGTLYYGFLQPLWCFGRTHWLVIVSACILSEGWGILYELYDHYRDVGASYTDIIWNNIGMIMALIAGFLMLAYGILV